MAGGLIGLGVIVPGLSPSNFLIYMGMYKDMADGIKDLNLMVIIPIIIGGIATVMLLSKLVDYIFRTAYTGLYHVILGVVIASTVMIAPRDYNYLSVGAFTCLALCLVGVAIGAWMCSLEKKYKNV
jgi:putative membrane protein